MKRLNKTGALILAAFLAILPVFAHAASGELQFCETLTDNFEPVKPGMEFPGPSVSWLASSQQPFGSPNLVITIYKNMNNAQNLVLRREIEVNPAWDNLGLRNMPLEELGEYTLVLSKPDGEEIAKGDVKIVEAVSEEPAKPEEKMGATLESLYKKYAPKK